jgi:DNA polymerase-3 subunit alpha
MKDFVHLHVHSEYSMLDGYAATGAIARRAADLGMESIALTDHGVMYGVLDFYDAAKKAGIKPIIGVEAYTAVGSHTSKETRFHDGKKKNSYHLLLLAKNLEGYRNLVKLTTRAHLDGFYYHPRIDHELLAQHKEGLIVTSACLAGELNQLLLDGNKEEARQVAAWYRDTLGPDNYYLELQLHPGVPQLEGLNKELVRIGKELGISLIATNDAHFVQRNDADAHRLIRALGFNKTIKEIEVKEPDLDDSYYIKSGEEMWELFNRYGPAPLENTLGIAERCNLELDFGRVQLPAFEIPEGHDAASYLRLVCEEGLMKHFNGNPPEEYVERLSYELDVINQTGFPDYMLIVWDYVTFARNKGIPCLPRGSAGASLVLYCLDITDVDPVANKLLFERFLSPERLEMPDIDTDFADSRRGEVIEYIAEKYGRENTAQIITYGTLGAKNALRDAGRVLEIPLKEVDRVASLIPGLPVGVTIGQALERVADLKQIYESDKQLRELIDKAKLIEGRMRNVGTHACGLVVSRTSLDETVPLQRTTRDETALMASYEGPALAKVGLLKMDILGLTNLSVVAEALNYIEQSTGTRMELADIPLDDRKTFESLSNGETTNVFQFESAGMTRYLRELKPTRVQDLYAMVALYRPGPLEQIPTYIHNKNNPQDITYLHPILEPILADTYGVIVYQEQIMQLLQAIAGYTLGRAYIVLKAIGKKKRDLMAQEAPRFKEGCLKNGLTQEQADTLWDLIQPFAGYSFNRPHSTLYGLLSYQTAYLKVNYPTEYMAAVLTAASGDTEDVAKSVTECLRLGVAVLPPHVNRSNHGFTIEELDNPPPNISNPRGIRFGLAAIKNVGNGPVESILAARNEGGPFRSLEDFCLRVERTALNKRVLESLVCSGAMDAPLPGTRHQKKEILDQAIAAGIEAQKAREAGQIDMFGGMGGSAESATSAVVQAIPLPNTPETPEQKKEELAWERELLGLYVSAHPATQALQGIDTSTTTPLSEIPERVGKTETFIGLITGKRHITTKKGDPMLVANLEDAEGNSIELVVFPKTLEKHKNLLDKEGEDEPVVRLKAKIDNRRETLQLIVEECWPVELAADAPAGAAPPFAAAAATTQPEMDIMDVEGRAITPPAEEGFPAPPEPQPVASSPAAAAPPARENVPPLPSPTTFVHAPRKVSMAGGNGSNGNNGGSGNGGYNGGNGNGNGGNGNGGYYNGHTAPASSQEPHDTGRRLHLHLPRTDNQESDVRRMQAVHNLLCDHEGHDQVIIYVPNGVGTAVLRPHQTVCISNELVGSLTRILGEERVIAER